MAKKPYEIHVISNTHWDREWLTNFQETRIMLMELMDKLLDIFDRNPDYKSYLMDSQVVPVEDYLAVRPERRESLLQHVRDGRFLIGPWYTAPEGFSVGGESMVRNLLLGHRVAKEYGGVMKVGHTPFGYGQNSQMPQIYQGFGIDSILFYHGVSHEEAANEFILEGADGTQILGSQMSSYARYNAYQNLYRAALYGDTIDERSYDWTRGGLPFHLCRGEAAHRQHLQLDPVRGWHQELLEKSIKELHAEEIKVSTTRHLAFMMGHDSSVPDEKELDIIAEVQRLFPEDKVYHDSYVEMLKAIQAEVDWDSLEVFKGERRTPKLMPVTMHLFSDVLSSRSRMKQLNTKAEYLLQRRAEPFACIAAQLGAAYPQSLLDLAWKGLLRCHAHDSIAGSGVDDIEMDMMHRLRQVVHTSEGVLRNALAQLQLRIDNSDLDEKDLAVTIFNASPKERSEVVTALMDLPYTHPLGEFSLLDQTSGEAVPVQLLDRKPHTAIVNHAGDAPANMKTWQYRVHLQADAIPALGYASYRVDRNGKFAQGSMITRTNTMENEHLVVAINPDGTLQVTHKESEVVYDDLNYFQDNGEAGHAWMHHNPAHDEVIDSRGFPVRIALVENGPLLARYRVDSFMEVPAGLDENGGDAWQRLDGLGSAAKRSDERVPLTISSHISLRRGAKHVEVECCFDNQARFHRLRAMFPTGRSGLTCHAESAFDVVERETVFGEDSPWHGSQSVTFPQQRFVDVSDGEVGLAVINPGLREYEVSQDADRVIAITLLRAYEVALCPVSKCWEQLPAMGLSQSPGAHRFTYRICPHEGDYASGGVLEEAEDFYAPLEIAQAGAHGGDLPKRKSFFELSPQTLVLDALKQAEDGSGWVLRLHNPTNESVSGNLMSGFPLTEASLVDLEEKLVESLAIKEDAISITVAPKKIITLKLVCA